MQLHELLGHDVRIECDNGLIVEGFVHMYTSAADNDPEPESITVDNYELYASDIKGLEIIK